MDCITRLGCWEGYRVAAVERFATAGRGDRPRVWIALEPILGRRLRCERCGGSGDAVHDVTDRWLRDLPLFDAETGLQVRRCRVWCVACGSVTLEGLNWLAPYARVTVRLGESVARLCQVLPVKHVAEFVPCGGEIWGEVIDRVRVDEANRLRHDRRARAVIKGARWLLLRNRENLAGPEDRVRLQELLSANRKLLTVYVLKDDLKHLWTYRYPSAARRFWHAWYLRAVRSRITPLVAFAKRLKPYFHGILAHCLWPLHTSLIEGINNKIKFFVLSCPSCPAMF